MWGGKKSQIQKYVNFEKKTTLKISTRKYFVFFLGSEREKRIKSPIVTTFS